MDAAKTNIQKSAFFLATALLLAAPVLGYAQPVLTPSTTAVTIGSNTSCNSSAQVLLTSTVGGAAGQIGFTVSVKYNAGDPYTNWLYTNVNGTGTGSYPNYNTGATGATLTIGLETTIFANSDSATVVLTPNAAATAAGVQPVSISVYYQNNSGCGGNSGSITNNYVTISPGTLSLTAALGAAQSQTLTVQNNTGQSLTFAYSTSTNGGGSWLSASANATTISPNGSTPISVTADGSKVSAAGTVTGIVTVTPISGFGSALQISVTFVVTNGGGGSGGSGTLTLNGASSSSYSASFTSIAQSAPGGQCIGIQDSAAGANGYSYQVTTVSGGNWLLANYQTSGSTNGLLAASSNACVPISTSNVLGTLGSGAYQGSVAITSSSGSTATIYVTLYVSNGAAPGITVNPNVVFSFPNQAVGSTALQSQIFSLSAASGYSLGIASATSTPSWFGMSNPTVNGNSEFFTVTANPTGLAAGIYFATITANSSGNQVGTTSGTTTILVTMPIGQAGATTGGGTTGTAPSAAPTSLSFQQQVGSSYWTGLGEAQTVSIIGPQGTQWSASVVYGNGGSGWLNFDSPAGASGTFGSGPSALVVDLYNGVQGLAASTTPYTATITITTPSGNSTISVSLLVTPANTAVLLGKPASATFASNNGAVPSAQSITVVGSDNTGSTYLPVITAGNPTVSWVGATTSGNTLTISINPAGLATGMYWGTIPVSSAVYSNSINIPVVLVVNGGGAAAGPLTLSTANMTFNNVTTVYSQTLNVTAASTTSFTATSTVQSCTSYNWLQITPAGSLSAGTVQTPISVTVYPAGIPSGTTCNGTVSLATSGATQSVAVSMVVGGSSGGGGNVTVSPQQMTFAYTQNQAIPASQTATIVNAVTGTSPIAFTVATAVQNGVSNWLLTSVNNGQTPYNSPGLSVSVSPGSLTPGYTYTGTVTITPTGGSPVTINVSITVSAAVVVTASPTSISLSYQVGGTSPTSTIYVSGGGAAAGFTAISNEGWLQVSPSSGTTPNTGTNNLAVSLNPASLASLLPNAAGNPYTGSITIAATSPATGTTIVNVTLNVTAPLPTITSITNAASNAVGPVSPGEIISIYANASNPIGPATAVQLNATTCPSPCTQVPTTMGNVQVIFLPSGTPAPLTYVSAGQINAVVPYEVANLGNLSVEVKYLQQSSNAYPVTLAPTSPGVFTTSFGSGQAEVLQYDQNGTYQGFNSASSPAKNGWYLVIYMTGEGVLNPAAKTGSVTGGTEMPYYVPTVLIGNQPATVTGYAEAPGFVSGVLQVNVLVPQTAPTGAASVTVSLGNSSSQSSVTVALQ